MPSALVGQSRRPDGSSNGESYKIGQVLNVDGIEQSKLRIDRVDKVSERGPAIESAPVLPRFNDGKQEDPRCVDTLYNGRDKQDWMAASDQRDEMAFYIYTMYFMTSHTAQQTRRTMIGVLHPYTDGIGEHTATGL